MSEGKSLRGGGGEGIPGRGVEGPTGDSERAWWLPRVGSVLSKDLEARRGQRSRSRTVSQSRLRSLSLSNSVNWNVTVMELRRRRRRQQPQKLFQLKFGQPSRWQPMTVCVKLTFSRSGGR